MLDLQRHGCGTVVGAAPTTAFEQILPDLDTGQHALLVRDAGNPRGAT